MEESYKLEIQSSPQPGIGAMEASNFSGFLNATVKAMETGVKQNQFVVSSQMLCML